MLLTVILKISIQTTLHHGLIIYVIWRFFLRKYADTDMETDKQGVVRDQIKVLSKMKGQKNL